MKPGTQRFKTQLAKKQPRLFCILIPLLLSCGLSPTAPAAESTQPAQKMNILFIICDDLNNLVTGANALPQAKTPNLDKLASHGVSFINAQANAPLCAPSRYSLTTGLYPHTLGVNEYVFIGWDKLPNSARAVTYMDFMKEHGYKVYGTGKIFHNHSEKKDAFTWADGSNHYGHLTNWGPWPWDGSKEARSDWGWASVHPNLPATFTHDSAYAPLSDIPEIHADPSNGVAGAKGWFIDLDGKLHVPFRYVNDEDRDPMPDEQNAEWTKDLLGGTVKEPFIISVGMNRPHTPMYAPKKYFDLFPLESIELPPVIENDLADVVPELLRDAPNRAWGYIKFDHVTNRDNCNGDGRNRWKDWIQAYLANVAFVDDQIGKVLTALENSPYASNTLVVVTSDNGYHMGQKEYMHKNTLWEESANIPLIAAGPGIPKGKSCDQPVSLIDLYPTFLDYAAIHEDPYANDAEFSLAGTSLRPLLENPDFTEWAGPAVALSEISGKPHPGQSPFIEKMNPEDFHYSVRSKKYRYIRTKGGQEELYDHQNDPLEWKNLATNPAFKGVLNYHRHQMTLAKQRGESR
ncbi:MAG: sulfatase [Kiritimatiellales bacterium]|nr:sulfatase [Kiritimatiellales bacterium]